MISKVWSCQLKCEWKIINCLINTKHFVSNGVYEFYENWQLGKSNKSNSLHKCGIRGVLTSAGLLMTSRILSNLIHSVILRKRALPCLENVLCRLQKVKAFVGQDACQHSWKWSMSWFKITKWCNFRTKERIERKICFIWF